MEAWKHIRYAKITSPQPSRTSARVPCWPASSTCLHPLKHSPQRRQQITLMHFSVGCFSVRSRNSKKFNAPHPPLFASQLRAPLAGPQIWPQCANPWRSSSTEQLPAAGPPLPPASSCRTLGPHQTNSNIRTSVLFLLSPSPALSPPSKWTFVPSQHACVSISRCSAAISTYCPGFAIVSTSPSS